MTIAQYNQPLLPTDHEMAVFQVMSKQAVESKMYKGIGDQAGVMMIMLAARELGLPPVQALNGGINIINGKVELSARMMNALMRKAGISIEVKESTDEKCTVVGHRGYPITASYTIEDARKAGLIKVGGGWVKNPKDMLFARAISRLARQIAPDIIGGCYIEGEISGEVAVVESDVKLLDTDESYHALEVIFPQDELQLFREFFDICRAHFEWSEQEAIEKFTNEPKLKEKFESWKAKRKNPESSE